MRVKVKWLGREPAGATPEYEDCRALAEAAGVPVRTVQEAATAAAQGLLVDLREPPGGRPFLPDVCTGYHSAGGSSHVLPKAETV